MKKAHRYRNWWARLCADLFDSGDTPLTPTWSSPPPPPDAHICQNCGERVGQHGWHVAARVHDVCPGDDLIEKGKA